MKTFLEEILLDVRLDLDAAKTKRSPSEIREMVLDAPEVRPVPVALSKRFCLIAEIKERFPKRRSDAARKCGGGGIRLRGIASGRRDFSAHEPHSISEWTLDAWPRFAERARSPFCARISSSKSTRYARRALSGPTRFCSWPMFSIRLDCVGFTSSRASSGMEALFEVHTEEEISSLPKDARVVGINSRKFKAQSGFVGREGSSETDFSLDYSAFELAEKLPAGILRVAESGLFTPARDPGARAIRLCPGRHALLRDARGIRACLEEFERVIRLEKS